MPASSALIVCVIVGISDGDTLSARCEGSPETVRVRLAEVDAPEHHQPFAEDSRQALATHCFGQQAQVRPIAARGGTDRYGRVVAHVTCNGVDANSAMVRDGFAWAFPRYVVDQNFYRLQDEARAAQRGLWRQANPVPPWEWRQRTSARGPG